MVIDHFNVILHGGASVAARRLHDGLRAVGVDSRFWHLSDSLDDTLDDHYQRLRWADPATGWFSKSKTLATEMGRKIVENAHRHYYVKGQRSGRPFRPLSLLPHHTPFPHQSFHGDLLHLHWIYRDLDWASFFGGMPDTLPILWTLHDMFPLTGGCYHADTCAAYTSECQHCPALTRPGSNDLANRSFQMKAAAYRGKNLHFVTPSRWMEANARSSTLGKQAVSIQTIYNGLDLIQFSPIEKRQARSALGLPMDGTVLAYGAESLNNRRKGIHEFLEALGRMPPSLPIHGLMFGKGTVPSEVNGIRLHHVGSVVDPSRLRMIYSAADIFVMPSHADNMPQTIVEALACGTPTVAFAVGGIPEIVRPHETGLLAPLFDVETLARHIEWLATTPEARRAMGIAGRNLVEREFDEPRQTAKYLALYRKLVANKEWRPDTEVQDADSHGFESSRRAIAA